MKQPSAKKCLWSLLIILLTVTTAVSIFFERPYENQHKTLVEPILFSGTYQLSDGTQRPLTDSTYIDACENQSVILRGAFDRTLEKDMQLFFFMEYMEVHIDLNGTEIYAWGTENDYPSFMRSSGAAWGHCVFPTSVSRNDEITITLESKYANNYNSAYHDFLNSLQTGDSGALARTVLAENWPYLVIGLLLFLIGLSLQLFLLSLARQGVAIHPSIFYCGLFILSASLWIVLNPEYSTLLLANASLIMLLETISMWLFSTFLFGYFGTFMQTRAKRANDVLLFGFVSALALFLILQLFGMTDAYAVREYHNLLLGVAGVAFLFIFGYEVHHAKQSQIRTLALPGLLYVFFGLFEMVNYETEWLERGSALAVGLSIFILAQFVFAVRQIRNSLLMEVKAAELEKKLSESHTAVMLSQIQPHFLYNSLQGIKLLCDTNPSRASEALEHFAFYLRGNLDSLAHVQLIPFNKELRHIKDYLFLEKIRFAEQLHIQWDLQCKDFMLPPLTVQPMIENAIRHGLNKKDGGGTVTIATRRTAQGITITISDDGVGFDTTVEMEDGCSHIGIANTRNRLETLCGGLLLIESTENAGTVVKIILADKEAPQ